jgi:type IV secretory pathway TrbL component
MGARASPTACRRAVPDVDVIADYLLAEHQAIQARVKALDAPAAAKETKQSTAMETPEPAAAKAPRTRAAPRKTATPKAAPPKAAKRPAARKSPSRAATAAAADTR